MPDSVIEFPESLHALPPPMQNELEESMMETLIKIAAMISSLFPLIAVETSSFAIASPFLYLIISLNLFFSGLTNALEMRDRSPNADKEQLRMSSLFSSLYSHKIINEKKQVSFATIVSMAIKITLIWTILFVVAVLEDPVIALISILTIVIQILPLMSETHKSTKAEHSSFQYIFDSAPSRVSSNFHYRGSAQLSPGGNIHFGSGHFSSSIVTSAGNVGFGSRAM